MVPTLPWYVPEPERTLRLAVVVGGLEARLGRGPGDSEPGENPARLDIIQGNCI